MPKMKFKVKSCLDCFWWQSQGIKTKTMCAVHEYTEYQPPAIIKEIKQNKRDLWTNRLIIGGMALLNIFFGLFWAIFGLKYSPWLSACFLIFFGGIGLIIAYNTISLDKLFRNNIKELQKMKEEWIIEYV